jgi:molybdopterin-guanine dinucleotide biosynthesis protein A
MRVLGVLLAGGRGSRLGSDVPKALVVCAGRTLLARALATLETQCDELVVVAPRAMELPVERARRVDDPEGSAAGRGPLAALVAGLAARPHEEALAFAVDMPLVTGAALQVLRERRGGALAVLAAPAGVPQPLAAWYAPGAGERLAQALATGERSLIAACRTLAPVPVDDAALASIPDGDGFKWNLNTREDLLQVERLLAARAGT